MGNLLALMCFAGLILFALIAFATMSGLSRLLRGGTRTPFGSNLGNEFPRFDDPNISSGGSFGESRGSGTFSRGGGEQGHYHDPNIRSGGSFG